MPVADFTFALKNTCCSPIPENETDWLTAPTGSMKGLLCRVRFTLRMLLVVAKMVTGILISSAGPKTRGMVASSINGFLTATAFSAKPYAPLLAAITIALTLPMYAGNVNVCDLLPPLLLNGPINCTMGLKRFAFFWPGDAASLSPPMVKILSKPPPHAPIT